MEGTISWPKTALAALIALAFLLPFAFLIATVIRTPEDFAANPGGLPGSFTLDNLVQAWRDANLGRALVVTLQVSVVACLVCLGAALPAAFWFRLHRGLFPSLLRNVLIAGYAIPMIAWLIPVFVMLAQFGLTGNVFIAGVLNGVASLPFAIYFLYTYFLLVLSDDILDVAALDGAKVNAQFWRIAVPLSRPALTSVAVLVFVWTFGDLLVAATLLQAVPENYTLPLAATTLATRDSVNLQGQAAAALVSLIPVLVIFAFAQRWLVAGFGGNSEK